MDTSKSNNIAILNFLQDGTIKGLPSDLTTLDVESVAEHLDKNKNVWLVVLRSQTLLPISSMLGRLQIPDGAFVNDRAIDIHSFNTSTWNREFSDQRTDIRNVFVKYFFTRNGAWTRITYKIMDDRSIVFDNYALLETTQFVRELTMTGCTPTRVLATVYERLVEHSETFVRFAESRLSDAESVRDMFLRWKDRSEKLLP